MKKIPSEIIKGDIFLYKGFELVAIDTWQDGCLWVTSPQRYIKPEKDVVYGYTSAYVETIGENEVLEVTGNMEVR